MSEILATFLFRARRRGIEWRARLTTLCMRLRCRALGVRLGSGCRFYGAASLVRHPGTAISIAGGCRFRSAWWSNRVGVNRPCMISTLRNNAVVAIGQNCGFSGTVIAAATEVRIGNNVICGANATIMDTDWHAIRPDDRGQGVKIAPVRIEDDVWIGMNVIVAKGVTIGRGSVIGAGSVVTRSIPPGVIAAGVPARVVRTITERVAPV